ncbi:MAG: hypothetical protein UY48_C0005G0046 [Candidatus Gottesmanbacteria bacterium GW2011_GWB1_49_7]|uniref:Uncharacterized protein n=1 Tax=Candidatus Gottesmanbacteria bacterium GW2011_GWB1_49_7 TaxID=1618448 RepID=A0A0G1W3D2_9BACT|nr:MAG: hypothetical protein UY48_C0005G0046 [Candidatus Gottesmanbacteria bacterium GW2011_GWB1_49_7]
MRFDFKRYQKIIQEAREGRSLRSFILGKGENALIRFNPHPTVPEPVVVEAHWIGEGANSRKVYCAAKDPKYPDGCYACKFGASTTLSIGFNVIDTRIFHAVKDGNKWKREICRGRQKGCPQCRNGVEAQMRGAVVWEMSQKTVSIIKAFADEQEKRCECGHELEEEGWECPECGESFDGKIPETERAKCSKCNALVTPQAAYYCEGCENARPRQLQDMYIRVSRTPEGDYSLHTQDDRFCPPKKEHQLEPINLVTAMVPPPPMDQLKLMGISGNKLQALMQALHQTKQITGGFADPKEAVYEAELVNNDDEEMLL